MRSLRGLAGFAQILGVDSTSCGSRRAGAREPTPASVLAGTPTTAREIWAKMSLPNATTLSSFGTSPLGGHRVALELRPSTSSYDPSSAPAGCPIDRPRNWIRPHYGCFNGLRGLAISLVFLNHYGGSLAAITGPTCWVGVDLFFVLSGFLIT